ncbi:MAG: SdrD B-like domain-containing protein [Ilumatobacteraceae bacterium]
MFDVGEGVPGVTVALSGAASATTLTGADGTYTFPDLATGTYTITETQPAGYDDWNDIAGTAGGDDASVDDEVSSIALAAGEDATGYVFREFVASSGSGFVFLDDDASGAHEVTDTGIAGVSILLSGPVNLSLTTDATGRYAWQTSDQLPPGTYTITEVQPAGYADGADLPGDHGGTVSANDVITVSVQSGDALQHYDFIEVAASISGSVFDDLDGDGVRDPGEPGIAGVSVGVAGQGSGHTGSTTTDIGGDYVFTDLVADTYTITETQAAGYQDGIDTAGSAGGSTAANDVISSIVVAAGASESGYTFAEFLPASLAGAVFEDRNGNGVADPGEPGISGVAVSLTGPTPSSTTTDGNGSFTFAGLRPGAYTLTETQPASHADGAEVAGTAGGSTAVDDVITAIAVASGSASGGYAFAELPGSLSGIVFDDLDGDGARDVGEPGIAGVTIILGGSATATTLTDVSGDYTFANLVAGTYTITESQPSSYADGPSSRWGRRAEPHRATTSSPGPPSPQGPTPPATRSASTYRRHCPEPCSRTGTRTGSRTLVNRQSAESSSRSPARPRRRATTDAAGAVTFTGLYPGAYSLTETHPVAYRDGAEVIGTGGGIPSAPDTIDAIAVASGDALVGYAFTEDTGSLSGLVFDDLDADGVRSIPVSPG